MRFPFLMCIIGLLVFSGCSVKKHKNIPYLEEDSIQRINQPTLNIFTPRNPEKGKNPVLLFVHGGDWNSGRKGLYGFFGRNFAKKGVTTIIVGYTLSPKANYDVMAKQVAQAVKWTEKNIANYNGDPEKIFLTGHSAGGHLVALVTTNPTYLNDKDLISGVILNDAAGLDMHHYLQKHPPSKSDHYITTWTKNPEIWKDASPIHFVDDDTPPFLIYLGTKTYPSITTANNRFLKKLNEYQPKVEPILLDKKHIPMITQYFWPWSDRYEEIQEFMELSILAH